MKNCKISIKEKVKHRIIKYNLLGFSTTILNNIMQIISMNKIWIDKLKIQSDGLITVHIRLITQINTIILPILSAFLLVNNFILSLLKTISKIMANEYKPILRRIIFWTIIIVNNFPFYLRLLKLIYSTFLFLKVLKYLLSTQTAIEPYDVNVV